MYYTIYAPIPFTNHSVIILTLSLCPRNHPGCTALRTVREEMIGEVYLNELMRQLYRPVRYYEEATEKKLIG